MIPLTDTIVDYPTGAVTGTGTVLAVTTHGDQLAVVLDRSCFHPVDPGWPDQGPDLGVLVADGVRIPVLDCVIGATDGGALFVGAEVPVRRGTEGWAFVVVHLIADDVTPPVVGTQVELHVDAALRDSLSMGHSACHVASLALNAALTGFWSKPVSADGLGHPDFDRTAMATSRIVPNGAVDTYRLGKSLRKKGFDIAAFSADLPSVQAAVNALLAPWAAAGGAVGIEAAGPGLTDLRTWVCHTPQGTARIACGGTHVTDLADFAAITVELALEPEQLTMTTSAVRSEQA